MAVALAALTTTVALPAPLSPLETIAANYRKTPNVRTRAAVLRFANTHPKDESGALALLVLGATEVDQRQFGDALRHLDAAGKRLPKLADTIGYLSAECQTELRDFPATQTSLQPVWNAVPASQWIQKSVLTQANSFLQQNQPDKTIALVTEHAKDLTDEQANLLIARADAAHGDSAGAASHYEKIYVDHPFSPEASEAESALAHYPPVAPASRFARALKLIDGGDYARARKELTALLPSLSGADLDRARVRIGAAQYLAGDYKPAREYLASFQVANADAEAERLYYLAQCARKLDRIDEMVANLDQLSRAYPQSSWRLQALIAAASYYTAHNPNVPGNVPSNGAPSVSAGKDAGLALYKTCAESFPNDPRSAQCQWKVAWADYLRDPSSAAASFREHLTRYPESDRTTAALYFLGRIAEARQDLGAARAYYEQVTSAFPNSYYSIEARERLTKAVLDAPRSAEVTQFLSQIHLAPAHVPETFVANATTKLRIERAHLLASAGLDDFAENELRFGAKVDGQPQLMAVELAELANRRDAPDQGIRYIKHYAPGYLSMSFDTAPANFWRLAFPMPYRQSIETYSREHSLDPYLVAALIRQESEFNPKALSRANARGLTQVMPGTGRELSRKLKIARYRTASLYTPDVNLKIGTYYLKALVDQLQGKWEAALASYNAGKSRVNVWLAASEFHEPAEFVESIPLTETRQYVQSVLRNAEMYRRLYSK